MSSTNNIQQRAVQFSLAGAGIFGMSSYLGYMIQRPKKAAAGLSEELEPGKRLEIFDGLARGWDKFVFWDEVWGRIKWHRRKMIGTYAEGRVLEVACGTGLNLHYYDKKKVKSLVLMDFSRNMMEIAKQKCDVSFNRENMKIKFRVGSAENINFPDESFDTVVDTFGICSFENPNKAISEMARVLKEGGKLVLLEHGKCNNAIVQLFLSRTRVMNLHKYGCDADRDMLALVRTEDNLVLETVTRKQWGHLYLIVARKVKSSDDSVSVSSSKSASEKSLKMSDSGGGGCCGGDCS